MASTASSENYLLKITLDQTFSPEVHRLLVVPGDLQFTELHQAIVAAFDWADPDQPCNFWMFLREDGALVTLDDKRGPQSRVAIYYTNPQKNFNLQPSELFTSAAIGKALAKGTRWSYDYNLHQRSHSLEIMEVFSTGIDKISCLGGRGHISHNSWQLPNLSRYPFIKLADRSTQLLNMTTLNARIKIVQDLYEGRKAKELARESESETIRRGIKELSDYSAYSKKPGGKRVKREPPA